MNNFGNESFLPQLKSTAKSTFKAGSYLDDDSLEVNKTPKHQNFAKKMQSPASSKKIKKTNPKEAKIKVKNPTTIEKMYDSLRNAGRNVEEIENNYQFDGPQVSINVGSRFGGELPESMETFSDGEQQQQNSNSFEIATGNINHGNRSVSININS